MVVALGMSATAEAKKVQVPKMYMFGMAASFNDTIVYFTNVQEIDSAHKNRKKVEKKYLKTRKLYMPSKKQRQGYDIRLLGNEDFQFKVVDLRNFYDDVNAKD